MRWQNFRLGCLYGCNMNGVDFIDEYWIVRKLVYDVSYICDDCKAS